VSGETGRAESGWTVDTLKALADEREQHRAELAVERDRRYTEIASEREKALKIKETADRDALGLAREIQTYKDEKANELRSQIERERGSYATQSDLKYVGDKLEGIIKANQLRYEQAHKPLADWMATQQGRGSGIGSAWVWLLGGVGCFVSVSSLLVAIIAVAVIILTR